MITIALGLPHTPWVPERVKSFDSLCKGLGYSRISPEHFEHFKKLPGDRVIGDPSGPQWLKVFDEKESNRVWPQKLWRWAVETGATHCLQLQDDVIVYERFWPVLRAMLEAVPNEIIGLESNHPLGPEQLRTSRRWYRTRAWLVGVGYVFPTKKLSFFLDWCKDNPKTVEAQNEDSLVSLWAATHGHDIWHPVPTIIDHDTGVPSTYGNDGHHEWSMYRRPTVTWRDVELKAGLEDPAYWRATEPPLLPGPGTQVCWFCLERPGKGVSEQTGARICPPCALQSCGAFMGISIQFQSTPPGPNTGAPAKPCEECGAFSGHHLQGCSLLPRPKINP